MSPAVVLVHGSWHIPEHYQETVDAIRSKGFKDVYCPHLPSSTTTLPLPATANLAHDTAEIRSVIQSLVDSGSQVILLMHSYGGIVGTNALSTLLYPQRRAAGLPGGVTHLIYLASFVLPLGTSLSTPWGDTLMPWLTEDVEDGVIHMKDPRNAFYAHIESDAEAQKWLDLTVLCPKSVIRDCLEYVPYEDKELKVEVQQGMAELLGEARTMEYCDAGHCAMLGYGETIADVVWRASRRTEARLEDV
ncbi:hypothetical protein LTR09_001979 [Extremus antarcticus]|uniref:AB hydrolase-1 domain-containing protein n=1 Tax=Extremus antarcticus TaxID=702011 RepID=A0AAJ0LVK7_9PEZI|nr:hypothetical protein LTR09_001979 [Extremus antarcticus]